MPRDPSTGEVPMYIATDLTVGPDTATHTPTSSQSTPHPWSLDMNLMNDAFARAHRQEFRLTDHQRRAAQLATARRLERRAIRARQRARRLSMAALTLQERF